MLALLAALVASPTLLTGCVADAETRAARAYVEAIEPLLYENGLLARSVLHAAAAVHDGTAAPAATRVRWQDEVVPLAEHLSWQAASTPAPAEWSEAHAGLVEAWSDRASAYRGVAEAVSAGDRERWRAAREAAKGALLAEEAWFRNADLLLAPHGLAVDQFP